MQSEPLLTDCLVLHDDAANELRGTGRGKEYFAVRAPALLGRLNAATLSSSSVIMKVP
jgi:hypothetical protein